MNIGASNGEGISKAEFWQRVAGVSFALWSLMIPLGVWMVGNTFERATKANSEAAVEITLFNRRFEAYVLNMERRVTIVEERQDRLLRSFDAVERAAAAPNGKR